MKAKKVYENVFQPKNLKGIEREAYDIVERLKSMGFICSVNQVHGVFLINFSTKYWRYNCDVAFVDKEKTPENFQKEFLVVNKWYANLNIGKPFTADSWQKLVSMIADEIFNLRNNDLNNLIQNTEVKVMDLTEELTLEQKELEHLKNAQRIINEG